MAKSKKLTKSECARIKKIAKNNEIIDKKHIEQGKGLIKHGLYGMRENKKIRKMIKRECK